MAKTRKVLDINAEGKHFVCIRDNVVKTYKLYELSWGTNKYGYPAEKRKLIGEYFMLASVLCDLADSSIKNKWGCSFITSV